MPSQPMFLEAAIALRAELGHRLLASALTLKRVAQEVEFVRAVYGAKLEAAGNGLGLLAERALTLEHDAEELVCLLRVYLARSTDVICHAVLATCVHDSRVLEELVVVAGELCEVRAELGRLSELSFIDSLDTLRKAVHAHLAVDEHGSAARAPTTL